jgi:hypothetical protein
LIVTSDGNSITSAQLSINGSFTAGSKTYDGGAAASIAGEAVAAGGSRTTYQVGVTTDVEKLARKLRRDLRHGDAALSGDFSRLKAIYARLIELTVGLLILALAIYFISRK